MPCTPWCRATRLWDAFDWSATGCSRFKPGQRVAVGVMVNSCMVCDNCKAQEEPYCEKGMVGTYNAKDYDGSMTYGGYASTIVTKQHFVHSLAESLDPAGAAPLLCAGITTYSPLKHWGVGPNKKVGVVGLGGLGHLGLKFSHSFGAHTVQFTTSESKVEDAKKLGADEVVISKDASQMAKHAGSFDFILDCVSAEHDLNQYLNMLKLNGVLCLVGLPEQPPVISPFAIVTNRRSSLRLHDWRHGRDAGNAGLLRREEHRGRCGSNRL